MMTENEFLAFAVAAARRATSEIGHIGHLVCTQSRSVNEPTLREPEICAAFQQEAEAQGKYYGIEVPTIYRYQFTGVGSRCALVDFALLENESDNYDRDVLVEFKEGQPSKKSARDVSSSVESVDESDPVNSVIDHSYPTIVKDMEKLLAEPGMNGRCMFHVLQASDAGTLPSLLAKYKDIMADAQRKASATRLSNSNPQMPVSWMLLLILVLRVRGAGAAPGSVLHVARWKSDAWNIEDSIQL